MNFIHMGSERVKRERKTKRKRKGKKSGTNPPTKILAQYLHVWQNTRTTPTPHPPPPNPVPLTLQQVCENFQLFLDLDIKTFSEFKMHNILYPETRSTANTTQPKSAQNNHVISTLHSITTHENFKHNPPKYTQICQSYQGTSKTKVCTQRRQLSRKCLYMLYRTPPLPSPPKKKKMLRAKSYQRFLI